MYILGCEPKKIMSVLYEKLSYDIMALVDFTLGALA